MDDFQAELSKYELKDGVFNGVTLNINGVAEYEIGLEDLFYAYFEEIANHIKQLSSEEDTLRFIALKKREFKDIWKRQTEIGNLYALNNSPLSVQELIQQRGIDEKAAILKREKSFCIHSIYEVQMTYIIKSLIEIMTIYQQYSNDLLTELRRFDIVEGIEYNDVPLVSDDIFQDQSSYMIWIDRLFENYFEKVMHTIDAKNDLTDIEKLIDIKIKTFNQIKTELSEKGKLLTNLDDSLETFCCKKLYEQQHQYIDKILVKLKTIQDNFLSKSKQNEQNQKKVQANESLHFTREFTEEEKEKLFEDLQQNRCLPQNTDYPHFCFVFGGTQSDHPFEPLKWQRTVALLAYFVDSMFGDTDSKRLWEITSNCFTIENNKPNKDSLKNTVSKIKGDFKKKPKGYETIDDIVF